MSPFLGPFQNQLDALEARARRRRLMPRAGQDFASNDYLGLAGDRSIARAVADAVARGVPVGSGGSRLLRGNAPEHEALEARAASIFGSEAALFLANGFAANMAILASLPGAGDLIVADSLIHASAHDGMKLGKARTVLALHNDADAFDDAIAQWRKGGGTGRAWIAAETLYSMDGDKAPVDALAEVAARHEAMLVLDEAHATAVHGPSGRGLAAHLEGAENVIALHTCGKGLGVEGALVTAARPIIDLIVNRGRSFIFSTAPSPLMAVAVEAALERSLAGDDLRAGLQHLIDHAAQHLCAPLGLPAPASQILPIILKEDARTMRVATLLQQAGFDVRGIRPPTVPRGTARLRVSLTLNVDEAIIDSLAGVLRDALEQVPA
ncbi:MAG: 8-amino-7-oxononanoate synthase [Alphaproteobacteria bacterium]|nr:8-amino-7-oxononanoate synthase [Alphaproteobacteria bacterium]MBU0794126.1 8-amino-7-oxononanoate synthase [Alphaproteobacteria bacterium]MBU0876731.1 8-amino-7-oxononanoate synthase [Alphaproteobacteria bacterium]MBU1769433.1 8-amino-7-oxononanoate synthase [Alphaproteobacteria bacterium]